MNRQRGFNLVELAIVLVIIGLLLGGILKGQALITSAKIKRVNNDFNGITAAIYTYLDRYGTLPGDDDKAVARWGLAAGHEGDANGTLDGAWNEADVETDYMWEHLQAANLVASKEAPKNAFGGAIGVEDVNDTIKYPDANGTDISLGINGIVVCMDRLTGEVAEMVDINFDDGSANSGLLKGFIAETGVTKVSSVYEVSNDYMLCKRI
jgi:prepilin-type N-terminal cleavage/methylation domain-containing protein